MEGHVLSTIGWSLGHPTAEAWLRLSCLGTANGDPESMAVAQFLMEITLWHKEFVSYLPSTIAAGSLLLAKYLLDRPRRVGLFSLVPALLPSSSLTTHADCSFVRSVVVLLDSASTSTKPLSRSPFSSTVILARASSRSRRSFGQSTPKDGTTTLPGPSPKRTSEVAASRSSFLSRLLLLLH
jgi:hypothetical protein